MYGNLALVFFAVQVDTRACLLRGSGGNAKCVILKSEVARYLV
jgi:hypothetical protein